VRRLVVLAALVGCKGSTEPRPAPAPGGPTWYRATVRAPDGVEARFFIGLPAAGAPRLATYKVGRYEMQNAMTFDGTTLAIPIPVHEASLDAHVVAPGKLEGTFTMAWRTWGASSLPLTADEVAQPTIAALETLPATGPALDVGAPHSVWKVEMPDSGVAKLELDQVAPGELDAMLTFDTGNFVYLAGDGRGDEAVLTGFDGTSVYRLELTLDAKRAAARGTFFAGHKLDWREALTATRAPVEIAAKVKATDPRAPIELPPLPSPLPPGPVVVELSGSWCSTCRYAAPVLAQLYAEYHPRGLQMVSLLYELTDDPAYDAKRAEAFVKAYGVTWPAVPISGPLEDLGDLLPSNLSDVNTSGFPITLFLTAEHEAIAVHAGFPAPDATAEHARGVAEFRAHVEQLLAPARP
jgi:thiol-disulfide isomerase/thioredoxin